MNDRETAYNEGFVQGYNAIAPYYDGDYVANFESGYVQGQIRRQQDVEAGTYESI